MYRKPVSLALGLLLGIAVLATAAPLADADAGDSVIVRPQWFQVISKPGDQVRFNLVVGNDGVQPVQFSLEWVETPGPEWEAAFPGPVPGVEILGVGLSPGDRRSMLIAIDVPLDAGPGDYGFVLRAASVEGDFFEKIVRLTVTVRAEESVASIVEPGRGVELQAPRYSSLTGEIGSDFEFNVVLLNGTDEPVELDLGASTPSGWTVGFLPAFTKDRQLTSLDLDPGASESIAIQVSPPSNADPGEYGIQFTAIGGDVQLSAVFEVGLTGRPSISIGTTGRLAVDARAGNPVPVSILVANPGTVSLDEVSLTNVAPEGWEVRFEPAVITRLAPAQIRDVIAQVRPAAEALEGDYRVTLLVQSPGAVDRVDILVTVTQTTVWGWVVLAAALIGLAGVGGVSLGLGRLRRAKSSPDALEPRPAASSTPSR